MTVPSPADLKKRADKLAQFRKKIAPDGRPIEKQVIAVVRSAIRSAWIKSDVKLAFMYSRTIPDMDNSTRTKWLYECEICRGMFKEVDIEVDHKEGHHKFTKLSEFENYFNRILMVRAEDLQVLCKGCHSVKTLSESQGITFEQAAILKRSIEVEKKGVKQTVDFLKSNGYTPASSKDKRRLQLIEYFGKEKVDAK